MMSFSLFTLISMVKFLSHFKSFFKSIISFIIIVGYTDKQCSWSTLPSRHLNFVEKRNFRNGNIYINLQFNFTYGNMVLKISYCR